MICRSTFFWSGKKSLACFELTKSVTASILFCSNLEEVDDEGEFLSKANKKKNMAIDEWMIQLNKAIVVYKPKYCTAEKKLEFICSTLTQN